MPKQFNAYLIIWTKYVSAEAATRGVLWKKVLLKISQISQEYILVAVCF